MNAETNLSGTLGIVKMAGFDAKRYRIRNRMRVGFWLGWLQVQLALLVNRLLGIGVLTSKLSTVFYVEGNLA